MFTRMERSVHVSKSVESPRASQGPAATSTVVRLDSLTGMRWWAAFFVFAYHMGNLAPFKGQSLMNFGYTGVSFFFVLSGFVLTWSARPRVGARQFWWRRVARIWPSHMVALALAVPVFYTLGEPDPSQSWVKPLSAVILWSVVLLQGFSTIPAVMFSGNPAAWTLSCEMFFYALHPLINPRRRSTPIIAWALLALGVAGGLLYCLADLTRVPAPLTRTWEFLLGMGAAHLLRSGARLHVPGPMAYAVLILAPTWYVLAKNPRLAVVAAHLGPLPRLTPLILSLLYVTAILIAASADVLRRSTGLRSRLLVFGGEISYCFYLVHATLLYAVEARIGAMAWDPVRTPLTWCAVFIMGVLLAIGLHLWVEKPLERWMRAWGDARFGRR